MSPTLLFYCQHSLGLGHLVRSLALARALREHFRVVLLAGGELPSDLKPPAGIELFALPALGAGPGGALVSRDGRFTVEQARLRRRELVLEALRRHRPAVVLVELFPFGRKKFAGELLPLLEAAHALGRGRPRLVTSLRDLLVRGRRDQAAHDERASTIANRFLDAVLVHADPRFARLEESFSPRTPLRVPVRYTGFVVSNPPPRIPAERLGPVVVSVGGGQVGGRLLRAAVDAHHAHARFGPTPMKLVAGPFLPVPEWDALRAAVAGWPQLELVRSVDGLVAELAGASASVSQCGYNTALDLLCSHVPALVVPYSEGGEDEQRRRAHRLERLGAVRVLDEEALSGPTLAAELVALRGFAPQPVEHCYDGAEVTAELLAALVATGALGAAA